jgi:hypothetical protein
MMLGRNTQDPAIRAEFHPLRFLFRVAELYQDARKLRLINEQWWIQFDKVLEKFDLENPSCYRQPTADFLHPPAKKNPILPPSIPAVAPTNDPPPKKSTPAPKQTVSVVINVPPKKTTPTNVPPPPKKSTPAPKPTIPASTYVPPPPKKSTPATTFVAPPTKKTLPPRERDPSPVPGPSRPRQTSSFQSSEESEAPVPAPKNVRYYKSGQPIPWPPAAEPTSRNVPTRPISPDSSYHSQSDTAETSGYESKGKGRARTVDQSSEDEMKNIGKDGASKKRERKPPKNTGQPRDSVCQRCVRLKTKCLIQKGGKACVGCATIKVKCVAFEEALQDAAPPPPPPATKKKTTPAPAKQPTIHNKPSKRAPAPKRSTTKKAVKSAKVVNEDESVEELAPATQPPPAPKRKQTKKVPKSAEVVEGNTSEDEQAAPVPKGRPSNQFAKSANDLDGVKTKELLAESQRLHTFADLAKWQGEELKIISSLTFNIFFRR